MLSPFVKHRVKKLLKRINWRLRPGREVRRSLGECAQHLAGLGFRPATVIDVGVADGTLELYENFPNAFMLLVEPISEFQPAIRKLLTKYRGIHVPVAAGASEGIARMTLDEGAAAAHNATFAGAFFKSSREVEVRTLDAMTEGLKGPFLLKVDVEGFELDVMAGATRLLERVEVVILETRFFDFVGGKPIFHEVVRWMADRGFVVYDVLDTVSRPLDDATALCDLVFVKRDGRFRISRLFLSPEQDEREKGRLVNRLRRYLGV